MSRTGQKKLSNSLVLLQQVYLLPIANRDLHLRLDVESCFRTPPLGFTRRI